MNVVGPDGKTFRNRHTSDQARIVEEVLQTDKDRKPAAYRLTVRSADRTVSATIPKSRAFSENVAVSSMAGVVRRRGERFAADTTTLVSATMNSLNAPQIEMVKRIFSQRMSFRALPDSQRLLLAPKPVAVASDVWKVPRADLLKWAKTSPWTRGIHGRPTSSRFILQSVEKDIATVAGKVVFAPAKGTGGPRTELGIRCFVNTRTGQWVGSELTAGLTVSNADVSMSLRSEVRVTMDFTPGTGDASTLPAGMHKLGWAPPAPDTNNYRNTAAGVSLHVPAQYRSDPNAAKGNTVAKFDAASGAAIAITSEHFDRPTTRKKLAKVIGRSLRADDDYELIEQTDLTLADNVPAVMLTGRMQKRKTTVVTLLAIDRGRVVTVTIGLPGTRDAEARAAKATARTLRVFEPDAPKPR